MNSWKRVAVAAGLAAAVGGTAAIAPAVRAQASAPAQDVEVKVQRAMSGHGGGRLGVSVRDATDDDVKRAGLGTAHGVVIEEVSDDSPAEKAGLKAGDVLVEFDGERVRSARQLTRLVQESPPGRAVSTVVLRDGQRTTLSVQPGEGWSGLDHEFDRFFQYELPARVKPPRPPAPPRAPLAFAPELERFGFRSGTTLGVTVGDLSEQLAEYFGAKDGALVTSVRDDSVAAKTGLRAGDVITSINGEDVTSPSDVRRIAQRLPANAEFAVTVVRDRKSVTLKGKTEPRRERRRAIV